MGTHRERCMLLMAIQKYLISSSGIFSSTTGFPSLSSQKNATMFSGFSPALLNVFCEKGVDGLRECTPMSQLMEVLDHPRYKIFSPEYSSNSAIV